MARQVTLIVETGSIVPDANSFVSEDDIVSYALMRGVTLPFTTDEEKDAVAVIGIKAMDYLRILPWKGEVVSTSQTTPFPRKNMNTTPATAEDVVPSAVKEAQLQLTLLVNGGTELIPSYTGVGFLVEQRIGPIMERYSEKVGVSTDGLPIFPGIQMLLDPYLLADTDGLVPVMIMSIGEKYRGC